MGLWDDYKEERSEGNGALVGDYRCMITDVEETTSKSGNEMYVLHVKPDGRNMDVRYYLVKGNAYFNKNLTSICDSFGIEKGDPLASWINAIGAARFKEDENGYTKIHFFLSERQAENLPVWSGEKKERQRVTSPFVEMEEDPDLPF